MKTATSIEGTLLISLVTLYIVSATSYKNGPTSIEQYPWVVIIEDSGNVYCFGAIVAPHWIVTSAICAQNLRKIGVVVRSGSSFAHEAGNEHRMDRIIEHEQWDECYINNIAVVRVKQPFRYVSKLREPIALFDQDEEILQPNVTNVSEFTSVTGWGLKQRSYIILRLQVFWMKIFDDHECGGLPFNYDSNRNVCARNVDPESKAVCGRDEGAPLVINRRLVGILNWFSVPCKGSSHTVYTKMSHYHDWIYGRIDNSIDENADEDLHDDLLLMTLRLFTCSAAVRWAMEFP